MKNNLEKLQKKTYWIIKMKNIGYILGFLIGMVLLVAIIYGMWHVKRKINYKLSYESMVAEQVEKRIAPLEKRIEDLEHKKD